MPMQLFLAWYGWTQLMAGQRFLGCLFCGGAVLQVFVSWHLAFRKLSRAEIEQNHKLDPEHCGKCGYSLTGNTSGVCPECGERI